MLGPEITGRVKQYGSLEEIISLSKNVERCLPVVDWCHLHARTNGNLKTVNDFTDVISKLQDELDVKEFHMHFSGVEYSKNNERRHLPLSSNQPNHQLLAQALIETEINTTLICESPLLEKDALNFKKLLQKESRKIYSN
jgi:deoxyribonuclease-4